MPDIPTSDSSASTSPLPLTPESTGASSSQLAIVIDSPSSNASSVTATTTQKARRQTAFYPNMNSSNKPLKPFSRSAAKRESVMALGSIEHLQHYFTKTGLASKKAPLDKLHHGLVPAIGGKEHVPTSPPVDITFQMPPSPVIPSPPIPAFSPHVKTYEVDPESLLPGVIEDVIAVSLAWKLDNITERGRQEQPSLQVPTPDRSLAGAFDVLDVLKTTTRAIRSTRNYLLSLPDESVGASRTQFRSKIFEPKRQSTQPLATSSTTTTITTSSSTSSTSTSTADTPPPQSDTITLIRRSALEVLTVLRQLEENCRLPLSDDAYDAQSDGGLSRGMSATHSAFASPANITLDLPPDEPDTDLEATSVVGDPDASFSFSLVQVQGRFESVPVWEDDDDGGSAFGADVEAEKTKRDRWDERLVLGNGWLYKQDIKLEALVKERSVVRQYLDVVDEVLFNGKKTDRERGWVRVRRERDGKRATSKSAKRRVSTGDSIGRSGGFLDPAGDAGRRRVSTGMVHLLRGMSLSEEPEDMHDIKELVEDGEEETLDDEGLPEWAKRSAFIDDKIGRAHALLLYFLPSHLQAVLTTSHPTSRTSFLTTLSSGQLLCIAYNACVRKSRQPWGFVSKDGIHDILALEREASRNGTGDEEGGKKVWTFRRTDNLRLWVGALKLRYTLPIQIPSHLSGNTLSTPLSSPSAKMQSFTFPKADHRRESLIMFDARVVAKKEEGWEDMLESVLMRWADKVVEERRVA